MAWFNNSWPYRMKLTVKASQVPANQSNFPVYVNLADLPAPFHENVKSDGSDIRVTSSDEVTEVAREVVSYVKSTSTGEMHFNAPTLSSSSDTVFYIYYGNSSATAPADNATYGANAVWSSSSAVYHLNEANNTTSNGYKNSKANSNHGTGTSMSLPSSDGVMGKAANFDGVDDGISMSTVFSMGNTNGTISSWVDISSLASKGTFVKVGTAGNGYAIGVGNTTHEDVGNKLIGIFDGIRWIVTSGTFTLGKHLVHMVVNGSGVPSFYLDGVLVSGTYTGSNATAPTTNSRIGWNGSAGRYSNNQIDEARFVNTARTANWILTEYRNQSSPQTFYKWGVQEWRVAPTPQVPTGSSIATASLEIPEYTVELWSSTGVYMADVSSIMTSELRMEMPLNDVEQVSFTLDLVQFEQKCARIGATPRNVLDPYRTEVKIKRNGAYLLGTQVVQAQINLNNESANTIEVRCTGYLNLFKDRYITPGVAPANNSAVYSGKTYAQLAQRLILDTQNQTNGNFGVTLGPDTASLLQDPTRTRIGDYDNQNVKDGIINLTKLEADNFDFKFTWDKRFEVYNRLGSDKPDVELVYPFNIVSMTVLRDATTLANKITGIGSGIGDERLEYTGIDSSSTLAYGVREKVELFNSVSTPDTLVKSVQGLVPIYKDIYEVPAVNLTNGAIVPGEVITGDAVLVKVEGSTFIETINELYRIINMTISVGLENQENISLKLVKWS